MESPIISTHANGDKEEGFNPRINEMSKTFIADCEAEKERLGEDFPLASMLIDLAIDKVLTTGRIPGREMHADVFKQKPIKVTQKVFVPAKQFPKFNFVGKILGPKGNSLRRLQEETLCRIAIKGRHSMRDSAKEEELRASGESKHAHLSQDLYVEISTVAHPAEAYARIAYALSEIRKYLIPDKNDEVSQTQMKESMADPDSAKKAALFAEKFSPKSTFRDKNPTVSILQKLAGRTANNYEQKDDDYDQGRIQSSYSPMRKVSQKFTMKTAPSKPYDRTQKYQNPLTRSFGNRPTSGVLI